MEDSFKVCGILILSIIIRIILKIAELPELPKCNLSKVKRKYKLVSRYKTKHKKYNDLFSKYKNSIENMPHHFVTHDMLIYLIENRMSDCYVNPEKIINFYLKYSPVINPFDFKYYTLTGIQFNKLIKASNITLVRLTNMTELHRTIQYVNGINIDTNNFYPHGNCFSGGLYFIPMDSIKHWKNYNNDIGDMVWKRKVTILRDSIVYIEKNKFKTNKFMLGKRTPILELVK